MGVATDKRVLLRVTDEHLVDIRVDRLRGPAGERTRLDGQKLLSRVDGDNPGDEFSLGGWKLLVAVVGAIGGHDAEGAGSCMQIESEVCCSHGIGEDACEQVWRSRSS